MTTSPLPEPTSRNANAGTRSPSARATADEGLAEFRDGARFVVHGVRRQAFGDVTHVLDGKLAAGVGAIAGVEARPWRAA